MGKAVRFHNDFETYSEADIKKRGTDAYSNHPSTEVLMLAYAFDDGAVEQWVPAEGQPMPKILQDAARDPDVYFFAWNKPFEFKIWRNCLGIEVPHTRWRDPMVLAYSLSFPGNLGGAGAVIGQDEDRKKSSRGKNLIRRFCVPRKPTKTKPWTRATHETDPADWGEFKDYNVQDVVAERDFWKTCRTWNLPRDEWDLWYLDQEINDAGVPINMDVVEKAIELARVVTYDNIERMREITGLANPNSGDQLLPWLKAYGYPFDDLKKGHVKRALERLEADGGSSNTNAAVNFMLELAGLPGVTDTADYREILNLRLDVSKSSVKKYQALADRCVDGVLRDAHQFAGAGRTWRWAGRGFQAQNLARPAPGFGKIEKQTEAVQDLENLSIRELREKYAKPMDLLQTCVRPVVQAPDGYLLLDADLNAIENRVLGYIADEQKILDVFREGRDPYIDFAKYMFDQSYEELYHEYKKEGIKDKRTLAKPPVLGCGYMLGAGQERENVKTGEIEATGLLGYAWGMFVPMTLEQSTKYVGIWRETYKGVVDFWYDLENAAKKCVRTGQRQEIGVLRFEMDGPFLKMILPSERALSYCRPELQEKVMPWGKKKTVLTYEGLNDKNQWVRISTHPGKLTENADQAIARDLLGHGIKLAKREGIDIRLHVHDQIVALSPENRAERELDILIQCMSTPPRWAGNSLPLAAEGHVSKYFVKD